MRNLVCSLFVLSLTLFAGCATQIKPVIDYDPTGKFADYKTFAFISEHPMITGEGASGANPLTEVRIMSAIEDVLVARGYATTADPESADFAISFTLGARDKVRVDSYPEPYRGGYGTWNRGWGGSYYGYGQSVNVSSYTEGILSIDLYDVKEHRPVWHGRATKKITTAVTDNPEPVIREIVLAIMSRFPPM